jgi:hypothetical protein
MSRTFARRLAAVALLAALCLALPAAGAEGRAKAATTAAPSISPNMSSANTELSIGVDPNGHS